ncbi:MAG TPA: hypothetical protein VIG68_07950, partial [Lysobacter sp.]
MNSAAEIIAVLQSRSAPTARLRQAARESWSAWLDRGARKPGHVTGAPAAELVAQLAAREPSLPQGRAAALGRWRAFAALWRQDWHPASREERWWRWTAGGVSFGWHVLIAVLLLVVTALRFVPPGPLEEEVIQVEYIGDGTPAEQGGGPAPPASAGSPGSAPDAAAGRVASGAPVSASPPSTATDSAAAPSPAEPAPAAAVQPLVTSTPVSPEPPVFTVPPTTLPSPAIERATAQVPELQVVEIPAPVEAPRIATTVPRVDVPDARAPAPALVERQVVQAPEAPRLDTRIEAPVEA